MSRGSGCCADEHVRRRQINLDCDDPAPDADMEEDEYAEYQLEDDSYSAPNSSWHGAGSPGAPPVFPPGMPPGLATSAYPDPAASAGSTWLPAGTAHGSFPPPPVYSRYLQMPADGALGHGPPSWPQPAGYPGADLGFAHQSWEHGQLQSQGGKKRKHQECSEGQKRIKPWPNRPFTRSGNAQQSTAQPQTLAWGGNAIMAAAANAKQEATAVSTGAAGAATADGEAKQAAAGEAKQAAGPDAAALATSEEPSAKAGFAKSSYGSSVVQAAVRASPGVLSNYQFSC